MAQKPLSEIFGNTSQASGKSLDQIFGNSVSRQAPAQTVPTNHLNGFSAIDTLGLRIPVELAKGVGKSVAGTIGGISKIGQSAAGALGNIPGLGYLKDISNPIGDKLTAASHPSNPTQTAGKTVADIAQFFIPGGAETQATGAINKTVDAAKFAEKFGTGAGEALNGILKVLGHGVVNAGSAAGITAAQTGGDPNATAGGALAGGLAAPIGRVLESVGAGVAKVFIPKSDAEAGMLQAYKASTPFVERIKSVLNIGEKNGITNTPKELQPLAEDFKSKDLFYARNLDKTGKPSTGFAQNVEPAGKYININATPEIVSKLPNYETGKIRFDNPLIVDWKSSMEGGWKTDLSNAYGGKTGKALSEAIAKDGYDGIITVDKGQPMEVVSLHDFNPTIPAAEAIPKELQPLAEEAKKYRSAEEFVKAQGKPVYHGSPAASKIETEGFKKKPGNLVNAYGDGIYLSTSERSASAYRGDINKGGGVVKAYLPKDINLKQVFDSDGYKVNTKKLIQEGYDGVVLDTGNGKNYTIFDPSVIKTKSQLTDFYNQATKSTIAKVPSTAASTAFDKGLLGTESMMGVQAKRAQSKLWNGLIEPALKQSPTTVDMPSFLQQAEAKITSETKDPTRLGVLKNALASIKEDFAGVGKITMEQLQKYKEGWAEFVPEKAYKGQPIAGALNDVRNTLAGMARQTIYQDLGQNVKQAYLDYGNLHGISALGRKAMTGAIKGGTGTTLKNLLEMATIPIGTVGGQTIYKVGRGIELFGRAGASTVRDVLGIGQD